MDTGHSIQLRDAVIFLGVLWLDALLIFEINAKVLKLSIISSAVSSFFCPL